MYMGDRIGHVLLDLLATFCGACGCRPLTLLFLISHVLSLRCGRQRNVVRLVNSNRFLRLTCRRIHLHGGLARTLASACIRARALTPQWQATAMTDAAIAAEVHQSLDVHRNFTA